MIEGRTDATFLAAGLLVAVGWMQSAVAESQVQYPIDHGFLSVNYEDMRMTPQEKGFDLIYVAPGAFERVGEFDGIMIDQPEVWIDRMSDYPGTKPDYLKAIVDLVRDRLAGALIRGGHDVVEVPGPRVVFMRVALTDLFLKRKSGTRTSSYTAIGTESPEKIIQTMLENFDVVEMALQLELVDLETEELLGAIVIQRGERGKKNGEKYDQRLDFSEFLGVVDEYAGRVRCRFDNGRLPQEEWADCIADAPAGFLPAAE